MYKIWRTRAITGLLALLILVAGVFIVAQNARAASIVVALSYTTVSHNGSRIDGWSLGEMQCDPETENTGWTKGAGFSLYEANASCSAQPGAEFSDTWTDVETVWLGWHFDDKEWNESLYGYDHLKGYSWASSSNDGSYDSDSSNDCCE